MYKLHRAEGRRMRKDGTMTEPIKRGAVGVVVAHCNCGTDHLIGAQEASRYAVIHGKIYRFCEKCDYKRNQYEPEEKRVIW